MNKEFVKSYIRSMNIRCFINDDKESVKKLKLKYKSLDKSDKIKLFENAPNAFREIVKFKYKNIIKFVGILVLFYVAKLVSTIFGGSFLNSFDFTVMFYLFWIGFITYFLIDPFGFGLDKILGEKYKSNELNKKFDYLKKILEK